MYGLKFSLPFLGFSKIPLLFWNNLYFALLLSCKMSWYHVFPDSIICCKKFFNKINFCLAIQTNNLIHILNTNLWKPIYSERLKQISKFLNVLAIKYLYIWRSIGFLANYCTFLEEISYMILALFPFSQTKILFFSPQVTSFVNV